MLSKKEVQRIVLLLVYVNSVNILFLVYRSLGFASVRPVFGYDYIVLFALIAVGAPVWISFSLFSLILLLELSQQFSSQYLFTLADLFQNLKFSGLYDLSAGQYMLVVGVIAFLVINLLVIRVLTRHGRLRASKAIAIAIGWFFITYTLDFFNGGSNFNAEKIVTVSRYNIGNSHIKDAVAAGIQSWSHVRRPSALPFSISHDAFAADSSGSQLLVIVESWGLPAEPDQQGALSNWLAREASKNGWRTTTGATGFSGTTTYAELRELLNIKGSYRNLLSPENASAFPSLPQIKKRQGYRVFGVHSFSGNMFDRRKWWPNIGIDSAYFLEELVRARKLSNDDLNYDTSFPSVPDKLAFAFLDSLNNGNSRCFGYLLTENTHLPFHGEGVENRSFVESNTLSTVANAQLSTIMDFISFLFVHIDRAKWTKVVIVGDHLPPFPGSNDRNFYSDRLVPYLILE